MKRKKILSLLTAAALMTAMSVPAFAAEYAGPADACAGVTGLPAETIQNERQSGKTYGQIASDYGKLPEFKTAMWEIKEDAINEMVNAGYITQEQADRALNAVKERQTLCDGLGNGGLKLGLGTGNGQDTGNGQGTGNGRGAGNGMRLRDGSCY